MPSGQSQVQEAPELVWWRGRGQWRGSKQRLEVNRSSPQGVTARCLMQSRQENGEIRGMFERHTESRSD